MARCVILVACALLAGLSGCASNQPGPTQSELQVARAEAASLGDRLSLAEAKRAQLEKDLVSAMGRVKDLEAAVAQATRDRDELKKKCDELSSSMVGELKGIPDVIVSKDGSVQANVMFESGSAQVGEKDKANLETLGAAAAKQQGVVYVDGFCDRVPVAKPETKRQFIDNLGLSLARAAAVARVLIDAKVPAERIIVRGFGSTRAGDATADSRRVEVRIIPVEPTKPEGK